MNGRIRWMTAAVACIAVVAGAQSPEAGWHADIDIGRVANPGLDIHEAGLFRLADGSLVARVRCGAAPSPESLRILLDIDEPTNGMAGTGADLMVEGDVLFRCPRFAKGWEWNEISGVSSVASEFGTRSVLLPAVAVAPRIRWAVETLDRDWKTVDRLPSQGMIESRLERLPEMPPVAGPPAPGVTITAAPPLAARFAALSEASWAVDAAARTLSVALPGGAQAPLRFEIRPVGAAVEAMKPAASWRDGERVKWTGTNAGIAWTLLAVPGPAGDLWIAAEFRGSRETAFDFAATAGLPAWAWKVADGSRAGVPLDAQAWRGAASGSSPSTGEARRPALWPFAAAASPSGTVALVADPDEPRPYFFEAAAQPPGLTMVHPLAVTPMTTRFPGRACVAFLVRGAPPSADPLRSVAAYWLGMLSPGATASAVPLQWIDAGADAAAARGLVGGPVAAEALRSGEPSAVAEAWRFVRLRPWWCEMPLPRGVKADGAEALRMLRFHAAAGGPLAWYAQSAILGASREAGDSILARVAQGPGGPALRVAVSTDPDFLTTPGAPWNRATLEWAYAMQYHDSPGVAAYLFDGFDGLGGLDYNRATLAAADRAAAHAAGSKAPGVPRALDAIEFLDAFRRALGPGRQAMALADPFEDHALFAPYADLTVFTDPVRPADGGARARRYRWLAGARPCVRVLTGDFEWMDPSVLRTAMAESLLYGFIPSPGRDAAGRSYWAQPAWVARDAAALRTYVPLARRLAAAGWRADGAAVAEEEGVDVESFGTGDLRIAAVRNGGAASREVDVVWRETGVPVHVVQPLTGACDYLEPVGGVIRSRLRLAPGEVAVLDLVPAQAVDAELSFLDGWNAAAGEGEAAAANLRALRKEMEAGVGAWVSCASPLIRGSRNTVAVRILNRGTTPLVVAEARLTGAGGAAALLAEPRILGAGEAAAFTGELTDVLPGATPWVTLSWRLQRGDREWVSARRLRAAFLPPVEVTPARALPVPAGGVAEIEIALRNHSRQRQVLDLVWDGDFPGDRIQTVLEPEEAKTMSLPVAGAPGRSGRVEVRVSAGDRELHRSDVRLRFPEAP